MKEEFLQYIWENALFRNRVLHTVSGKQVEIFDIGKRNRDAGPDFFNARIYIDGIEWAGNVEIHCRNSDWNKHGHSQDAAYNNVILSVVIEPDVKIYNKLGREIETVILDYPPQLYDEYLYLVGSKMNPGCKFHLSKVDPLRMQMILQAMAIERLERKCDDAYKIWEQTGNDWEECFYRLLCKYWAGNVNSEAFYCLSMQLPYKILLRYADKSPLLEALLLGCAGLLNGEDAYINNLRKEFDYLKNKHNLYTMPREQWKFMRIRPNAFPTLRLALLASFVPKFRTLLSQLLEISNLKEYLTLLDTEVSAYWQEHYRPDNLSIRKTRRIGNNMKYVLLVNVVIPFLFLYGKKQGKENLCNKAIEWLETCPPENNYIIRSWREAGCHCENALQTQALIEITREYCERHRCLECRLSYEVLKCN